MVRERGGDRVRRIGKGNRGKGMGGDRKGKEGIRRERGNRRIGEGREIGPPDVRLLKR